MRKLPALISAGLLALLQPSIVAQQVQPAQQPPPSKQGSPLWASNQDGGVTQILQSIYIPPLLGAPFSAIVHTEWARPLPGGGSYTVVNQRKVARDSQGRIYEERWFLVPKDGQVKSQKYIVQIADPNVHTLYNCFLLMKPPHCTLLRFGEPLMTSYTPPDSASHVIKDASRTNTHEDLGVQYIQGVYTTGTRDSTTIKAGVIGNDRPVVITREFWNAPSLGVNLISKLSNPLVGTQTFTLSDVNLDAPDPNLFEVPEGFEVIDRRPPSAEQ